MQERARGDGATAVAVGFSAAADLAPVADHLGWRGTFLADTERLVYGRLGLDRAPWWRVYTPRTLAVYARARRRGEAWTEPDEDTRQLGGDAVVTDGVTRAVWRPRSPDDRNVPSAREHFGGR